MGRTQCDTWAEGRFALQSIESNLARQTVFPIALTHPEAAARIANFLLISAASGHL
jgi:hypothetical protein